MLNSTLDKNALFKMLTVFLLSDELVLQRLIQSESSLCLDANSYNHSLYAGEHMNVTMTVSQ